MSGTSERRRGLPTAEAARALRQRATQAETALWDALRDRGLDGLKFRRQRPLGPFVVDFVCLEARLVVEVDGPIHDEQAEQDDYRAEFIASYGFRVLRVSNDDVLTDLATVLDRIKLSAVAS
jgi:very-short-patch-repair endonuclease